MKKELAYYELSPKVTRTKINTRFQIRPLSSHATFADSAYEIEVIPLGQCAKGCGDEYKRITASLIQGNLVWECVLSSEQEYHFLIHSNARSTTLPFMFAAYAVEDDLAMRYPFKGDLHVHSNYSADGIESPEYIAGNYRKHGYDFMALTDHHTWESSLYLQQHFAQSGTEMLLLTGEEVHPPQNHIHTVNICSTASVNCFFREHAATAMEEIEALMHTMNIPQGLNRFECASTIYTYRKIKEFGGISILCHPFWKPLAYHMPEKMLQWLFDQHEFDCFEVLGGHEWQFNALQTSFYHQRRAQGQHINIVGSNDSHGTEDIWRFDWFSTIVFAHELTEAGIREALLSSHSVALETYPNERPRVYGEFRLVKYALFLLHEYFPLHANLCFEEGRLMQQYTPEQGKTLCSATTQLRDTFFHFNVS